MSNLENILESNKSISQELDSQNTISTTILIMKFRKKIVIYVCQVWIKVASFKIQNSDSVGVRFVEFSPNLPSYREFSMLGHHCLKVLMSEKIVLWFLTWNCRVNLPPLEDSWPKSYTKWLTVNFDAIGRDFSISSSLSVLKVTSVA